MVVLLIGMASVVLLVWIARLGEQQRDNFLGVDALDDLHIQIATFHRLCLRMKLQGRDGAVAEERPGAADH